MTWVHTLLFYRECPANTILKLVGCQKCRYTSPRSGVCHSAKASYQHNMTFILLLHRRIEFYLLCLQRMQSPLREPVHRCVLLVRTDTKCRARRCQIHCFELQPLHANAVTRSVTREVGFHRITLPRQRYKYNNNAEKFKGRTSKARTCIRDRTISLQQLSPPECNANINTPNPMKSCCALANRRDSMGVEQVP